MKRMEQHILQGQTNFFGLIKIFLFILISKVNFEMLQETYTDILTYILTLGRDGIFDLKIT